jgi:hypothetical protein
MNDDVLRCDHGEIRGLDSNSLLRLYDRAKAVFDRSGHLQERRKADRVVRRIARELHKRNVSP